MRSAYARFAYGNDALLVQSLFDAHVGLADGPLASVVVVRVLACVLVVLPLSGGAVVDPDAPSPSGDCVGGGLEVVEVVAALGEAGEVVVVSTAGVEVGCELLVDGRTAVQVPLTQLSPSQSPSLVH